jgi:AAA domain
MAQFVANRCHTPKGGVGKTSTCHHLSGTLALLGQRVLLVDNDPQASLTQGFFGPIVTRGLDPATTIAAVLAGDLPEPSSLIRPTGCPAGLPGRAARHLRPGHDRLPTEPPPVLLGRAGGQ